MSKQGRLAIFDLDYTLTRRGTWGRFTWQIAKKRPHIWIPLLLSAFRAQWLYKKNKIPRVDVKVTIMRWSMRGWSKTGLLKEAKKFAQAEVPDKLRPGGIRELKNHQKAGDTIIIVSAAIDILVREIAELLDVPYFLATDMAWRADDQVKMEFATPNCYGPEKVKRLEMFFADHPEYADLPRIIYSDSHSDLPLMQFCQEAVAVHPDDKLKTLAKNHEFTVVNWDN